MTADAADDRVNRSRTSVAVALAVLGLLASACAAANVDEPVTRPHAVRRPRWMAPVASATPSATSVSEREPVAAEAAEPEALSLLHARIGQKTAPLVVTASPPRVTALSLDDTARGEAPGGSPLGPPTIATLKEGEAASTTLNIDANQCVTFIAQGGLGIIEVDLFLVTADAAHRLLAEDSNTGPIAVVGGRGKCIKGTPGGPTPVMVYVAARRGAGVVLVRGYSKS